jgi:hypothetical protein
LLETSNLKFESKQYGYSFGYCTKYCWHSLSPLCSHCQGSDELPRRHPRYRELARVQSALGDESFIAGLAQGTNLTIQVSGPDEETFSHKLVALFQTRFDFPPRAEGEPPPVSLETLKTTITPPQPTT